MRRILYEQSCRWCCVIVLCALCLCFLPARSASDQLPEGVVRAAAQTWVRQVAVGGRANAVVSRMEPHLAQGQTVAYVAHLGDGGFCLCGADDRVLPVYLYCPDGNYDPRDPACEYFLADIARRAQRLKRATDEGGPMLDRYGSMFQDRREYWESLARGDVPVRRPEKFDGPEAVTLDMTSLWHQWSPYNDLCPELTPAADEHCAIGCVAGSLAGIMRYWQWPITGVGSASTTYYYRWRSTWDEQPLASNPGVPANWGGGGRLEWTAAGGGKLRMNGYWDGSLLDDARLINDSPSYRTALEALWNRLTQASKNCSANFGATTYQWGLMQDDHTDPPDAGDVAVATLCYQAGVAVEMGYGVRGSGAGADSSVYAYRTNFRYDDDVEYVVRDTGNYATGFSEMMDEIQWLRPVQYFGWEMAHSWIIFAYDRTFLPDSVLWGMNSVNGAIDWCAFDPVYANHCFIRRIAPESVVRFVGEASLGDGSPDDPYRDIQEAIAEAPDYSTLVFEAGSDNRYSTASLVIDRPLTLKGKGAVLRRSP